MIGLLEKNGFEVLNYHCGDLEIGRRNKVGLISLKKDKNDIKAHRQSGNRLDYNLLKELKEVLLSWRDDDSISSLILTSSHKVAFSRGAAIEEILGASEEKCRDYISRAQDLLLTLQTFPKPVVAAVNGLTLGGGFELILACDRRICGTRENVVFGFPETSLGLIPAMGGTQNLRRIIGAAKAREIITGAAVDITAEKALELAIVSKAVPPGALLEEAFIMAEDSAVEKTAPPSPTGPPPESGRIREEVKIRMGSVDPRKYSGGRAAPLAAAMTDFIYEKTAEGRYAEGLLYELEVFCRLQQTGDCREGIQAMIDEREPRFAGK